MILYRYIRNEVMKTSWIFLSILGIIALGSAFLELLPHLSSEQLFIHTVVLLCLQIPRLLVIILPISFFSGILLTYARMFANGQMTVLQLSGLKWYQFFLLLMKPTIYLSVFLLVIQGWGVAYAANKEQQILHGFNLGTFFSSIEAGQFINIPNQNKVMYVSSIDKHTGALKDIFIADWSKQVKNTSSLKLGDVRHKTYYNVVRAQEGYFIPDSNTIVLKRGSLYENNNEHAVHLKFDSYQMQIPVKPPLPVDKKNNVTLSDLLLSNRAVDTIELVWQLGSAMNLFIVLLIAVPLSYVPVRKDMKYTLILAFLIVLFYYNSIVIGRHWLTEHVLPAAFGIWWIQVLFVFIVMCFTLCRMQIIKRWFYHWKYRHET